MKVQAIALIGAFALSALAAACASDPDKEVKHAEANLTSEQQQARANEARLNDKQVQEVAQAQQTPMTTSDRAELNTKQLDERAEMKEDNSKNISDADKDVTKAHADMQHERSTVEADAKARFLKADAKAWEARNKSAKVPANKKAKFNTSVALFNTKKTTAQNYLSNLSRASNEEFKDAKAKLDKSLDELENSADRLHDDL